MASALESSLARKLRNKRIIFTVTTGRSGTAYLTTLFGYVRGVAAFHEPEPEFRHVLRRVQQEPQVAKDFLAQEKLPAIAASGNGIYVETSHLFCKGFLEPTLEIGIVPELIIHSRPHRQVAASLYRMGTIPGRTPKAMQFYLSPEDPGVLPLENWQRLHDYQLCYWYCLEIERRSEQYREMYRRIGGRVVRTTLDELKTTRGYLKMLRELEIRRPSLFNLLRHKRNSRFRINESLMKKRPVKLPADLQALEEEVQTLTGR
jgi:hypothetical protein